MQNKDIENFSISELSKEFIVNKNINNKEKEKLSINKHEIIKSKITNENDIDNILSFILSNKNQIRKENQYIEYCMDKYKL